MVPEAVLTSAILPLKSWLPAVLCGKWQSVNTAVNALRSLLFPLQLQSKSVPPEGGTLMFGPLNMQVLL